MYIIFNKDGSVKEEQLDTYVNQHSDGVNFIDIAIDGYDYNTYTASASFLLRNGETLTATASASKEIVTSCGTYNGWRFYLYSAQTQYEGDLSFSVIATQSSTQLFTYLVKITVNATARQLSTSITWDEYTQLLRTISDYQLQYSPTNVRGYYDYSSSAKERDDGLAEKQFVIAPYATNLEGTDYELYYLDKSTGTNTLKSVTINARGNRSKFVYKAFVEEGDAQSVQSGLCSYYTGTDGVSVNYGQNPSEFYALVTKDEGANYAGEINLGAKAVQIETGMEVDGTHIYSFKADQNTTELKNPTTGTSTLTLGTGSATLSANAVSIDANNVAVKGAVRFISTGGKTITEIDPAGAWAFTIAPSIGVAPTSGYNATNKDYVDDQDTSVKTYADTKVEGLRSSLQDQINAINASQNFVATYASKADMPTPPVSGLDDKDCVLVLQDESHESKAYVYKHASTGWTEVGPIGDYATSTELSSAKTELNKKISALPIKSGTGANSAKIGLALAASGAASVAGGEDAEATGNNAFALGRYASALGSRSYALGASCTASGDYSYALGAGASATAERSYAIGQSVKNGTANSVAIGSNFTAPTGATFSVGADNKVLLSASSSAITASATSIAMETVEPVNNNHVYVFQANQSATTLADPSSGTSALVLDMGSAALSANTSINLNANSLNVQGSITFKSGSGSTITEVDPAGQWAFTKAPYSTETPTGGLQLTNKSYVDNQISALPISKDASGNAVISGDLSVGGTFTATKFKAIEAETLDTERYTIGLAKGNTSAITSYVGLYAAKYDGTNDGALVWDNTGTAYVGDASVDADGEVTDPNKTLQPLLTRAEASSLSDQAILAWDADASKAVASTFFDIGTNGIAINGNGSDGSHVLVEDQYIVLDGKNGIEALAGSKSIFIIDNNGLTLESGTMKANELDNASGNALVRFKETEAKNVFGGVNYDAVLMGKSDRPYYSKSGSDFNGSALALASDITTMTTATSDSTEVSE